MHGIAIRATLDFVVFREIIPMSLLLRGQHARALAEWTGIPERRQDGFPNELGFVRHPVDQLCE
jgi:hypothetical protein